MKKAIPLFLFTLFLTSCSDKKNCENFKTGKFRYTNEQDAGWEITRVGFSQVEVNKEKYIKVYSDIEWTSDCDCTLKYTEIQNSGAQKLLGKITTHKIVSTKGNKCVVASSIEGGEPTYFEMEKIN